MLNYLFTFSGGVDGSTLLAFLCVATFAFLAPRLGYNGKGDLFMNTLHLLIVVMIINFLGAYFMPEREVFGNETPPPMVSILLWAKMGLQVVALLLLLRDLKSLQLGQPTDQNVEPNAVAPTTTKDPEEHP